MRAYYQDHETQRAARGNVQLLRVLKKVLRVTWFGNYAKDSTVRRDVCCWVRGTFPPPLLQEEETTAHALAPPTTPWKENVPI